MNLKLVYRSYGGENLQSRPAFYSKELALASFIRAAREVDREVVFLNDGPIPEDLLRAMEQEGEVAQTPAGPVGMRGSYWMALNIPGQRGWGDEAVVHFSEDDYLYLPHAFTALAAAARALPEASYLALYASTPRHANSYEFPDGYRFPPGWPKHPDRPVEGQSWVNSVSTTSTFAARVGALKKDLPVFRQCMYPFRKRLLDHETCILYQGQVPYHGREVLFGRPNEYPRTISGVARVAALVPFRLALNARALARRSGPSHLLYAAEPNLACHLTEPVMTPGRDWSAEAKAVADWAGTANLPFDVPSW